MSGQGDSSIYRSSAEVPKYVHKTTRRFWACYQRLPRAIRKLTGELADHFNLAWAMPIMRAVICTTGTLYCLERNQLPQAQFAWNHGKIPRIANMVTKSNGAPAGFVAEQLQFQDPSVDFKTLKKAIWDYDRWDEVIEALGLLG